MKRFVSLILSVCFLFSINTVSYAANISSRKASNPVIQSMNDKYHVDFSGMSIHKDGSTIDGSSYPTSYTGAFSMMIMSLFSKIFSTSREERRSFTFWVSPVGIPPHLRKRFQLSTE